MGEANCRRANTSASSTDALLWFGPDTRSARGRRAESIRTLLTYSNSSSPSECGEAAGCTHRLEGILIRTSVLLAETTSALFEIISDPPIPAPHSQEGGPSRAGRASGPFPPGP